MVTASVQQVDRLATRLPLVRLLKLLSVLHDWVETPVRTAPPRSRPQNPPRKLVHMNRFRPFITNIMNASNPPFLPAHALSSFPGIPPA